MNEDDQGADLERRFAGTKRLYGADAVRRFGDAHVCVIGIGGGGGSLRKGRGCHRERQGKRQRRNHGFHGVRPLEYLPRSAAHGDS